MLLLPTKGTYLFALSLVLGLIMAGNLDSLLRWVNASEVEPVAVEEPVVRHLPEAEMLQPAPKPEQIPEEQAESQESAPQLAHNPVESKAEEKQPSEPVDEESDESRPAELQIAQQLPEKEAKEFKELVKEGKRLKKEKVYPKFRAEMKSEVIEKLLAQGLIQLALTNGGDNYYFLNGTFGQPGELLFRQKTYLVQRGFSGRAMFLKRDRAVKFMRRIPPEKLAGNKSWRPVILIKEELDYMVLSAQSRFARQNRIPFKDVLSTSGGFQFRAGYPFNYEIKEIVRDEKKTARAGKAPLKKTEIQ